MEGNSMIQIPVALIEFQEGGRTIWIHNSEGCTVLRLQAPPGSKITVNEECENICSHVDLAAKGNIEICLKEKEPKP